MNLPNFFIELKWPNIQPKRPPLLWYGQPDAITNAIGLRQ